MDYNKKDGKQTIQKTVRIPIDLNNTIEKLAETNDRDFSKQIIHMLKKYLEFQEIPISKRNAG